MEFSDRRTERLQKAKALIAPDTTYKAIAGVCNWDKTYTSKIFSGRLRISEKTGRFAAIALAKIGNRKYREKEEEIFQYIYNNEGEDALFGSRAVLENQYHAELRENEIFSKSGDTIFSDIPVRLSPHLFFDPMTTEMLTFCDYPRSQTNTVLVSFSDGDTEQFSSEAMDTIISEIKSNAGDEVILRELEDIKEKSNPYLRLSRVSAVKRIDSVSPYHLLTIECQKSGYHIGAIYNLTKDQRSLSPTLLRLSDGRNLSNLAVRVAMVFVDDKAAPKDRRRSIDKSRRIILHRRSQKVYTYRGAWDVSAAGYLDHLKHKSDIDHERIDISKAARNEINEELGIPEYLLPTEEHFDYFGLTQNVETGQSDIICQCIISNSKWRDIKSRIRKKQHEVDDIRDVDLTPKALADFISENEGIRFVPSGMMTILLCLREAGFDRHQIIDALALPMQSVNFAKR
ncbi:hypothetical protein [Mesorhizobium sp. B2-3-4]|uniref:hypothetical protein n=1 Tax=Mesorhizobium sp. B2-3-4 TaxID=2589959 RepID=UPI0011279479|nr:hypothetical protein [Mesorhizobium sp. B2-3-4]TPM36877.1 hypothetical protein FJ967_17745 [Mesorhizobium sp. B2-3-4]